MRKINSNFNTKFISEPGTELVNNDYFAFVELDDYACYVMADGITDASSSGAAKFAVETIISLFQDSPSIKSRKLRKYLKKANEELVNAYQYNKLKASVLVVVTDYEHMRYASAGNVRLRLYRGSNTYIKSADMSLSQKLCQKGEIEENAISRHIERNNLYAYLGQEKNFRPYISPEIKLKNTDIISLYTRGVWENVEETELDDAFAEATDDAAPTLNAVEDLILSKQAEKIENYTMAILYLEKVFVDPLRDEKRKRRIRIAIIVVIILLLIGILVAAWRWYRNGQREDMQQHLDQTVVLINANSYPRAAEECKKALDDAQSLKDADRILQLEGYQRLIDAVIKADAAFKDKNYPEAYELYQDAMDCSRYADDLGEKYIERRMAAAEKHLTVSDLLAMGDQLVKDGDLDKAEARYLEAQAKAIEMHSAEDKAAADNALAKLADLRAKTKKDGEDKVKKAASDTINDYIAMGEALMKSGDFDGAEQKFLEARNIANANYDDTGKKAAMGALDKLAAAKEKRQKEIQAKAEKSAAQAVEATQLVAKGDTAMAAGDTATAKAMYLAAADKYGAMGDFGAQASVNAKLQAIALKESQTAAANAEAGDAEKDAADLHQQGDYYAAKAAYQQVLAMYQKNGNEAKVKAIRAILEQIDTDIAVAESNPPQ